MVMTPEQRRKRAIFHTRNWERKNSERNKAYRKEYAKTHPEVFRASTMRSRAKYPERHRARNLLYYYVKIGKVVKPKICKDCKKRKPLEGHHPDYSKPLDVEWLCRSCHCKRR
jgi:hypothetical protein